MVDAMPAARAARMVAARGLMVTGGVRLTGPYGALPEGPSAGRDTARYVIEVMESTDPAYERRKEITHARMRRIGRVIRMDAKRFDSLSYDLETQARQIARRIRGDLLARWKPA